MTFSLSYLKKLPQTLILIELAMWFRLWCKMAIFVTRTSPPKRTQSPLTFQTEHAEAVPWRGWCSAADAACGARHSCLPAHLPSAHCQRARQRASACDYRKPLPNPQLSGLSCWHLPISHGLFHTTGSARISLESEGRGGEQSLFTESCGEQC